MKTRLPIPNNWQDFEELCFELWRDIWSDANAQKNGRQGQAQHGVDVWGRPVYSGSYAGVQCKDKDGRLGSELTSKELEAECSKALNFLPDLAQFTLATTAPRDKSIQEYARIISSNQDYPFEVSVWAWDDIEREISYRPKLSQLFYPNFPVASEDSSTVKASPLYYRDQFEAFFARPDIRDRIRPGLMRHFRTLCYELSDNAFRHGSASSILIRSEESRITIEDNGISFNPLEGLDAANLAIDSHAGSHVFADFRERLKSVLTLSYERSGTGIDQCNRLILDFSEPTRRITFEPYEVLVDLQSAFSRPGAERLAASIDIPQDGRDLLLVIHQYYTISAIMELVRCVLIRMPSNTKVILSVPSDSGMERIAQVFNESRVEFAFR